MRSCVSCLLVSSLEPVASPYMRDIPNELILFVPSVAEFKMKSTPVFCLLLFVKVPSQLNSDDSASDLEAFLFHVPILQVIGQKRCIEPYESVSSLSALFSIVVCFVESLVYRFVLERNSHPCPALVMCNTTESFLVTMYG